jgi:hypothetical protein
MFCFVLAALMAVTAWKPCGTGANDGSVGMIEWLTPTNITASNDMRATTLLSAVSNTTQILRATNFGFSTADIPAGSTIQGVEVGIERMKGASGLNTATDLLVRLRTAAGQLGDNKATATGWPATDAEAVYGGAADGWGSALTDATIRTAGFGVDIRAQQTGGTPAPAVDHVRIRVHYTVPPVPIHPVGSSWPMTLTP